MSRGSVVFTTASPVEAQLVKGLLESQGIKVFLFDENISRMNPLLTPIVGGVRVVVPGSQAAEAAAVLRDHGVEAGKISPFDIGGTK